MENPLHWVIFRLKTRETIVTVLFPAIVINTMTNGNVGRKGFVWLACPGMIHL